MPRYLLQLQYSGWTEIANANLHLRVRPPEFTLAPYLMVNYIRDAIGTLGTELEIIYSLLHRGLLGLLSHAFPRPCRRRRRPRGKALQTPHAHNLKFHRFDAASCDDKV